MTLPELQTQRDALLLKIAAATRRLQAGDKSIEYGAMEEMERGLRILDSEIAKLTTGTCRQYRINPGSGY